MPSLTPERIEQLRQSGIRLDREGRLWHKGGLVTHARFQKALLRWLDRLPDGRTILRLDDTRYAYVDVDDAHLLVTSVRWENDRAFIRLNDESSEELCYDTLEQADDSALYCKARNQTLLARFQTQAYYQLAERIEEMPASSEREPQFALRAAGRLYPVGKRSSIAGC